VPILNENLLGNNLLPIIEVTVLPSKAVVQFLKNSNGKVPRESVSALIDTGASNSCITSKIARNLILNPTDRKEVSTPAGKSKRLFYDVGIILPGLFPDSMEVQAIEVKLIKVPYQVLLGRDILNYCTLFYNGLTNQFTLHY